MKTDTYQEITEQIIEKLKRGVVPWRKPWTEERDPCLQQQAIGINPKPKNNRKIENCERLVENFSDMPEVKNGNRGLYHNKLDYIAMLDMGVFDTSENYYCTLFHELIHSTGHKNRLNRETLTEPNIYKSYNYCKEELIAEMGAIFLCSATGIEKKVIDNSAAYIREWLESLKNDPKMVILAAGAAQKAADYVQK